MLNAKNNEADWDLVSGRRKVRVHVSGPALEPRLQQRQQLSCIGDTASGCCHPLIVTKQSPDGRLVRLLPKWSSAPIPVFAVYPSRKFLPSRLSVFLEALAKWNSPLWVKVK